MVHSLCCRCYGCAQYIEAMRRQKRGQELRASREARRSKGKPLLKFLLSDA